MITDAVPDEIFTDKRAAADEWLDRIAFARWLRASRVAMQRELARKGVR
jgi:hypothetical protein